MPSYSERDICMRCAGDGYVRIPVDAKSGKSVPINCGHCNGKGYTRKPYTWDAEKAAIEAERGILAKQQHAVQTL